MEYNRKINKAGGITIPSSLRRSLGIQGGERVVIDANAIDGSISIKRIEGSCVICKVNDNLKVYEGRFFCQGCIDDIKKL